MEKEVNRMELMPNEFDLSHNNLGLLASCAAVAIDHYLIGNGHYEGLKGNVKRLGKILYMATQPNDFHPSPGFVTVRDDWSASVVLNNVFKVYDGDGFETIGEVVQRTREVGLDIIKFEEHSREKQEELGGFCLELSKKARDYWQDMYGGFRRCVA